MRKITYICSILNPILLLLLGGCGGDEIGNNNLAPKIITFEAEPGIVPPGGQVNITLKAADLENDILTYTWYAADGEIIGDADGAIWIAPNTEKKCQIQVTVSDGTKSISSTIDIQVWNTRPGNYYPLAVGNFWRYRGNSNDEITYITFEIVNSIQIHLEDEEPIESFVLESVNLSEGLENVANYSYLGNSVDEDGIVTGIVQHALNITPGSEDTMLFEPFIPLYKFPLIPGEKWEVKFGASLVPELFPIGEGVDEFEVISEETVTVPAGTFENVFVVQESFRWHFDLGDMDFPLDTTIVQKWIAPDVGIIKFTQVQTRGDIPVESIFELESYELTTN